MEEFGREYDNAYTMRCSECGKWQTVLAKSGYKYKVRSEYQCSYTCYDHALMRLGKRDEGVSDKKMWEYIKRNENSMRAQGKKILHPITELKGGKYHKRG